MKTMTGFSHPRRAVCAAVLLALAAASLTAAGCSSSPERVAEAPRPNVVYIIADDTGWNDVGYHNPGVRTPNIDRMAAAGAVLDQFYVYPTCSPTRVALLAGRPPSRWGIFGPIGGTSHLALPPDTETLPDVLKEAGYQTAITGKWHLGLRPNVGPDHYGFDHTYGYLHGQIDPYTHRYKFGDVTWHRNGTFIEEEGHVTDLITDEAVRYIEELRDPSRPFFLYVPYNVPHYPLAEPDAYVDPYRESIDQPSRRLFAASMTHMDEGIGRILEALRSQGLRENTLVVFSSDNGGQRSWMDTADQYDGRYPPDEVLGDNEPLRGWKGDLYEGGIRVPAVLYWPGTLEPRTVSEPVIVHDVMPTLAALAGAPLDDASAAEGVDVWRAVSEGADLADRVFYWRDRTHMAVRRGDWKLVHLGETPSEGRDELYDLSRDPYETRDVKAQHPELLASLRTALATEYARDGEGRHF